MSDEEKTAETLADQRRGVNLDAPVRGQGRSGQRRKEEAKRAKPKKPATTLARKSPRNQRGAQRAKLREARLLSELQAREREIEELRRAHQPAAQSQARRRRKSRLRRTLTGTFRMATR
jgi:hypothetical protein